MKALIGRTFSDIDGNEAVCVSVNPVKKTCNMRYKGDPGTKGSGERVKVARKTLMEVWEEVK